MTFAKRLRELMEKHSRQEDSFRRYHIAIDMENLLHDNADGIAELAEAVDKFAEPNLQYNLDKVDGPYLMAMREALKKLNGGEG